MLAPGPLVYDFATQIGWRNGERANLRVGVVGSSPALGDGRERSEKLLILLVIVVIIWVGGKAEGYIDR